MADRLRASTQRDFTASIVGIQVRLLVGDLSTYCRYTVFARHALLEYAHEAPTLTCEKVSFLGAVHTQPRNRTMVRRLYLHVHIQVQPALTAAQEARRGGTTHSEIDNLAPRRP